jgi:hypothetical protein
MDFPPTIIPLTIKRAAPLEGATPQDSFGPSSDGEAYSTCESLGGSDSIRAQPTYSVSDIETNPSLKTLPKSSVLQASQSESGLGTKLGAKAGNWKFFGTSVNQYLKVDEVVEKLESGRLWVVNGRRRNGLIVLREFHAEFAGPGAAVGGDLDQDVVKLIPIGNLSLLEPDSHEAHQNAIKIRLQWIRLTQNFTDQPSPDDRARMILEQFKTYFDQTTVDSVPDEAFALLVGVLPQTIHRVRSGFVW